MEFRAIILEDVLNDLHDTSAPATAFSYWAKLHSLLTFVTWRGYADLLEALARQRRSLEKALPYWASFGSWSLMTALDECHRRIEDAARIEGFIVRLV